MDLCNDKMPQVSRTQLRTTMCRYRNLCAVIALLSTFKFLYSTSEKSTITCPEEQDEELMGGSFEGDMDLTHEQIRLLTQKRPLLSGRSGHISLDYRWPNQTLYYVISDVFDENEKQRILKAMAQISAKSCLRFEAANGEGQTYLKIFRPKPKGCSTSVGYRHEIKTMKLGKGCMKNGIIQHELLHSLGFFHQHSDSTRDDYVTVKIENVKETYLKNFRKYENNIVGDFGVGYDYQSVLHYKSHSFSKNGEPTLLPKVSNVTIGQRKGLSEGDFLKLNRMYNCSQ